MSYMTYVKALQEFIDELSSNSLINLIKTIYLRGSFASGEEVMTSDLDINIILEDNIKIDQILGLFIFLSATTKKYKKIYDFISVPKVMSFKAWQKNMGYTYILYGQKTYLTGKVLYGEPILDQIPNYKLPEVEHNFLLYKSFLHLISSANFKLYYALANKQFTHINLKYLYRILKVFLQIETGYYYTHFRDAYLTSRLLFEGQLPHLDLFDGENFTINPRFSEELLLKTIELIDHLFQRVYDTFKAELIKNGKEVHLQEVDERFEDNYISFAKTEFSYEEILLQVKQIKKNQFIIIGSQGFIDDYYEYNAPLVKMRKAVQNCQNNLTVNQQALMLDLKQKYSYITFNWFNKMIEYQLSNVNYILPGYVYDYLRNLYLVEKKVLLSDEKIIDIFREWDPTNRLIHMVDHLFVGNIEDWIRLHYQVEEDIFKRQLL